MADARTVKPGEMVAYHNESTAVASTPIRLNELIAAFRALTNEQRLEVMSECCTYCGTLLKPCYCMRDD